MKRRTKRKGKRWRERKEIKVGQKGKKDFNFKKNFIMGQTSLDQRRASEALWPSIRKKGNPRGSESQKGP